MCTAAVVLPCCRGAAVAPLAGNLRWMAPEIFLQSSGYSLKADVFSYALVVWELITRQVPFADIKAAQAAYEMSQHNRPAIPSVCPEPISKLIVKCWHPTASKRPSFHELTRWLRNSYPDAVVGGEGGALRAMSDDPNESGSAQHVFNKEDSGSLPVSFPSFSPPRGCFQ